MPITETYLKKFYAMYLTVSFLFFFYRYAFILPFELTLKLLESHFDTSLEIFYNLKLDICFSHYFIIKQNGNEGTNNFIINRKKDALKTFDSFRKLLYY